MKDLGWVEKRSPEILKRLFPWQLWELASCRAALW